MNETELALSQLREKIDQTDQALVQLLVERLQLVRSVARVKQQADMPILQPGRWQEVLSAVCDIGETLGLDRQFVTDVWNRIHEEALRLEQVEQKSINKNGSG